MSALRAQNSTIFNFMEDTSSNKNQLKNRPFLNESKDFMFIRELYNIVSQKWLETKLLVYLDLKLLCNQRIAVLINKTDSKKLIENMCNDFAKKANEYYSDLQAS